MRFKLFFISIIVGFIGLGLSTQNTVLGVGLLLVAFTLLSMSFRKRTPPRLSISVSKIDDSPTKEWSARRRKGKFEAVGNTKPICPHCQNALDKMPGRKKKCPHCGHFIFVRTRPRDEQRVLVTEKQAEQIEEQWSIVNGTHAEYLAKKRHYSEERARLAKRFGREPSDNDVAWSILNQDMIKYASQGDWGLYRNAKFQMAEILRKESRMRDALATYLEVCYIDLNGPNNVGGISNPKLLREFPPWDPKNDAMLAPGILSRIGRILEQTETSAADVETLFVDRGTQLKESLRLSLAVSDAWHRIREDIF